jgi:hypothetical protein
MKKLPSLRKGAFIFGGCRAKRRHQIPCLQDRKLGANLIGEGQECIDLSRESKDMAKKAPKSKNLEKPGQTAEPQDAVTFHTEMAQVREQISKLTEAAAQSEERLQDLEIHVNLLTRLLTTLCIEKFGMRIGVLKRMIKRIETEAIRDSQILHLENLYKMAPDAQKKANPPTITPKNDPWDEIS